MNVNISEVVSREAAGQVVQQVWQFVQDHPWQIAAVLVAYHLLALGLIKITDYFKGYDASATVAAWTMFHVIAVFRLWEERDRLTNIGQHPRKVRRFKEVFGYDSPFSSDLVRSTEGQSRGVLGRLARELQDVFDEEQQLINNGVTDHQKHEALKQRKEYRKKMFWEAHGLAEYFGYSMFSRYSDYLRYA